MDETKKENLSPSENNGDEQRFERVVRHMLNTPPYRQKKKKPRKRRKKK